MPAERPWLNHGGTTPDNPLVIGAGLNLILSKQDANETLRKCWVNIGKSVFKVLTPLAISTAYEITVPILVGQHLLGGSPPLKNVIHFTTSQHRHARAIIWVAARPRVMLTLDGYNGEDPEKPLIYALYDPTQEGG